MLESESGSHFAEELLERYAVGQLPEPQIASLEEHLLVCLNCQVRLADLDEYTGIAKVAITELSCRQIPRHPSFVELVFAAVTRSRWTVQMPVWAAGVAVVALMTVPFHRSPDPIRTEVALSAPRGGNMPLPPRASSHANIVLKIDATWVPPGPAYQVQVVNSGGNEVWRTVLAPTNHEIVAPMPAKLAAGHYWVRLSTASDLKLLQEYSLSVD